MAAGALDPIQHPTALFIGGGWVKPSSSARFDVIDSATEETFATVVEAQAADVDQAVSAARRAFDVGPWPQMSHDERAGYLRALSAEVDARSADVARTWTL